MLIKELQGLGFDFQTLPADLQQATALIIQDSSDSQKMSVLDEATFDAIKTIFPEDSNVLAVAEKRAKTLAGIENDGFNTIIHDKDTFPEKTKFILNSGDMEAIDSGNELKISADTVFYYPNGEKRKVTRVKGNDVYSLPYDNIDPKWSEYIDDLEDIMNFKKQESEILAEKNAREKRFKEEAEDKAERELEYKDIDGFADGETPMKKGKILSYLNSRSRSGRRLKVGLREMAKQGGYIMQRSEGPTIVVPENDGAITIQDKIYQTKTGREYLEYLKTKKEYKMATNKSAGHEEYKGVFGDYDADNIDNVDDPNPIVPNDDHTIEKTKLSDAVQKVIDVKGVLDGIMATFVPKLKAIAPPEANIYARVKPPFSIINKLVDKRLINTDEPKKGLTDLIGTTLAVDGYNELVAVREKISNGELGEVFEEEDLYAQPKNGYRAIHYILLIPVDGAKIPIEVQLKTNRMKQVNKLSHAPYKQKKLNAERMLELTELADAADKGNRNAAIEFDRIMEDKNAVQDSLFLKKMAEGGVISQWSKVGVDKLDMDVTFPSVGRMDFAKAEKSTIEKYPVEWNFVLGLIKNGAEIKDCGSSIITIEYNNRDYVLSDNGGEFNLYEGTIQGNSRFDNVGMAEDTRLKTCAKVADQIIAAIERFTSEEADEAEGFEFYQLVNAAKESLPEGYEFDFDKPTIFEKTLKSLIRENGASHLMKGGVSNGLYFSYRGYRFFIFDNGHGEMKLDCVTCKKHVRTFKSDNRPLLKIVFGILETCDKYVEQKITGTPIPEKEWIHEGMDALGDYPAAGITSGGISNSLREKLWTTSFLLKNNFAEGGVIDPDKIYTSEDAKEHKDNFSSATDYGRNSDGKIVQSFRSPLIEQFFIDGEPVNKIFTHNKSNSINDLGHMIWELMIGQYDAQLFHKNAVDGFIYNTKNYYPRFDSAKNYWKRQGANEEDLAVVVSQLTAAEPEIVTYKIRNTGTQQHPNQYAKGGKLKQAETGAWDKAFDIIISKKYANPFLLNRAIEQLIEGKNSTNPEDYTSDEKRFISLYSGMGGLEKFGAKGAGLLYEYFTPDLIAEKMWGLAYKHGFNGGKVAEPSTGVGAFVKYANADCDVVGYEINKYSYMICKILYPHVKMYHSPFERRFIHNNDTVRNKVYGAVANAFDNIRFDLVIGNPPYGPFNSREAGMGEASYTRAKSYVEYFISRGLDITVSGGLLIYIVGVEVANGGIPFLQQGATKAKLEIAEKADLLEAYRLPNGVFDRTDVVSDILVFRKK